MNDLLMYIDQIQKETDQAEINVLESLIQTYDKSIVILEQCEDSSLVEDIFQEGEKLDKFKEDTKAPVLGNKGEGIVKRLLMIIPRLIQKLIALMRKTRKKIQNKLLLRKIEYIKQNVVSGGKASFNIKVKGKLDREIIRKTLRAIHDDDFKKDAIKSGKFIESYISESNSFKDGHDPIRDVVSKNIHKYPNKNDTDNIEKLKELLKKYNEEELLDFFMWTVQSGELRSKYKYHEYLEYLKRYDRALQHFDGVNWHDGECTSDDINRFINVLKGIKVSSNNDSGNTGQSNPFVSTQYQSMIPIDDYWTLLKEISDVTKRIENMVSHVQLGINWKYGADVASSKLTSEWIDYQSAAKEFLNELRNNLEHQLRYQADFDTETKLMSDYVSFVQYFWQELSSIYEEY